MASARYLISRKKEILSQIAELQRELKFDVYEVCHCPVKHRDNKEFYFSGSYDTQAYSDYWEECTICGKRHNKTHQSHGFFG